MQRRDVLRLTPAALAALSSPGFAQSPAQGQLQRKFPRGQQSVPAIGMGTWLTFDVGDEKVPRAQRREVLQRFFAGGGGVIDSSPMYGRAQQLLGELLPDLPHENKLFTSTKVWTAFQNVGPRQLEESLRLWKVPRFDLVLVHNVLKWEYHLKMLREWKDAGRVRYIGISTSHGRNHDEVRKIVRNEAIDAIQITYNFADMTADPVMNYAAERGLAVFINRPFDGGLLFNTVGARGLPPWAAEIDCANWAQFFLKWVVSHPAVTCAIPATTRPDHMDENMGAGRGRMPTPAMRQQMAAFMERL